MSSRGARLRRLRQRGVRKQADAPAAPVAIVPSTFIELSRSVEQVAAETGRLLGVRERLLERDVPPNTARAYEGDWRRFEAWCQRMRAAALPADPDVVRLYLVRLAD